MNVCGLITFRNVIIALSELGTLGMQEYMLNSVTRENLLDI